MLYIERYVNNGLHCVTIMSVIPLYCKACVPCLSLEATGVIMTVKYC